MNLTVRHLRAFNSVAQLGSFSKAASYLHMTSPALSMIVKDLEEQTQVKLFDRTTRSVKLTQAGMAFLPQAQRLLAEHRNMEQFIHSIRANKTGMVRIAATQLLSCTIFPPALSKFRTLEPSVNVIAVDAAFDRLQELVLRGDADVGVGPERPCEDKLYGIDLFASPLNVVCSRTHAFSGRATISWSELADEKLILVDKGAAPLLARDAEYKVIFEPTFEVGHFTTGLAIAAENEGVLISSSYARKLLLPYGLVMIPLTDPPASRRIIAYLNRERALSPTTETLIKFLSNWTRAHQLKA